MADSLLLGHELRPLGDLERRPGFRPGGHADFVPRMPMEAHRAALRPLGAMPCHEFAEHVAGQAIIGLPVAAQPAADGTEADEVPHGVLPGEGHQVVGPVDFRADGGLHVFAALALETRRAVDARAVQDAFDRPIRVANRVQHGGHGRAVATSQGW